MPSTLIQLLARGDVVAVEGGRLTIAPASGRPVPAEWLAAHQTALIAAAARATGVPALEYLGHQVGNYGHRRTGGVTLQFRCIVTGQARYAIFNVDTRRTRTTQHGAAGGPLPEGQFRAGKRSAFMSFWQSTCIPFPRRMGEFHDCMGKLGELIYTATQTKGERLDAKTLRPLSLSREVLSPDNDPATTRQAPGNYPARLPGKEAPQLQQRRGLQPDLTTGGDNCGKTVIRKRGNTGSVIPPEEQSHDEWFADYDAAEACNARVYR